MCPRVGRRGGQWKHEACDADLEGTRSTVSEPLIVADDTADSRGVSALRPSNHRPSFGDGVPGSALTLAAERRAAIAAAAPLRVVSTFLCTDEYVFRLVPRGHIAALSFEAGDRNPVVSTISDRVGGIALIRPSAETVLNSRVATIASRRSSTLRRS